jgi:hypothetical protein
MRGNPLFAKRSSAHGENEPRTGVMLVNGEAFPAPYWHHAEWTEPLPQSRVLRGTKLLGIDHGILRVPSESQPHRYHLDTGKREECGFGVRS